MADRGNAEVAYYDEAEATLDKQPEVYTDFTYDNETDGGIITLFDETIKKVDALKEDVASLETQYGELQAKYDKFTNFNETMDGIIRRMNVSVDAMESKVKNIVTTAQNAIEDHVQEDTSLMDDLEALNEMLGIQNDDDWNQSTASFTSGAGVTSGNLGDGTTTSDGTITGGAGGGKTVNDVADEVIAGKYGSGDERIAALEKEGYDAGQIQDVVNKKMRGEDTSEYGNTYATTKSVPAQTSTAKTTTSTADTKAATTTADTKATTSASTDTKATTTTGKSTIDDSSYEPGSTATSTTTTSTTDTKTTTSSTTTDTKSTTTSTKPNPDEYKSQAPKNADGSTMTPEQASKNGELPPPIGDGSSEEARKTAEMLKNAN